MTGEVYITKFPSEANYKVYFTDFPSEEKNIEIIKGCKLTNFPTSRAIKVYITKFSSEAQIKIMRKNFPK